MSLKAGQREATTTPTPEIRCCFVICNLEHIEKCILAFGLGQSSAVCAHHGMSSDPTFSLRVIWRLEGYLKGYQCIPYNPDSRQDADLFAL